MNRRRLDTPCLLLDWIIQRGHQILAVRVSRAGKRYEVR
jgi:hypothetical protein